MYVNDVETQRREKWSHWKSGEGRELKEEDDLSGAFTTTLLSSIRVPSLRRIRVCTHPIDP